MARTKMTPDQRRKVLTVVKALLYGLKVFDEEMGMAYYMDESHNLVTPAKKYVLGQAGPAEYVDVVIELPFSGLVKLAVDLSQEWYVALAADTALNESMEAGAKERSVREVAHVDDL